MTSEHELHRPVHLVGSYPAGRAREAMELALTTVGEHLSTLSDGETGERSRWIVDNIIEKLRANRHVQLRSDGKWTDYEDRPVFRPLPAFSADCLELGISEAAHENYPDFTAIRAEHGLLKADLSFQVGIPGPFDLSFFSFVGANPVRDAASLLRRALPHRATFRQALARELREVTELAGDDAVFQLECPLELILTASAPGPLQPVVAHALAADLVRLVAAAPEGTRWVLHLCRGNLELQAKGLITLGYVLASLIQSRPQPKTKKQLTNCAPLVALVRALCAVWPPGRTLEGIHLPLAAGDDPTPLDPAFYRHLARLADHLPDHVQVHAGLVHKDRSDVELEQVLRIVEQGLRRRVGVADPCGYGRQNPDDACRALERAAALAAAPIDTALVNAGEEKR